MTETGSIKFSCERICTPLPDFAGFTELNRYRRKLFELGAIGANADGVGFGNISIRDGASSHFYVTGSATGTFEHLTIKHYARVTACDFQQNWVRCEGEIVASSESLTHAAIYESSQTTRAVIHVHNTKLWDALLDKVPTTPKDVDYGTPAMAGAVKGLFKTSSVLEHKIFVMAGHQSGIITFGHHLVEAFDVFSQALAQTNTL